MAQRKDLEHQEQKAFFDWCKLNSKKIPDLSKFYANPNGGHRHIAVAAKLKREGVKKGQLDTMLPVPRGGFCGLTIEFKAGTGKPSEEQINIITERQKDGWLAVICWDWQAAARVAIGYIGLPVIEFRVEEENEK